MNQRNVLVQDPFNNVLEQGAIKKELSNKKLIHYEVCLNNAFQSSKEIDKTFLTLSSLSIGVLITLSLHFD